MCYTQFILNSLHTVLFVNHHLHVMCTESSQGEDGLQQRVCALLSLPWVCEYKSSSDYRSASFPPWVPVLAQRLCCCYCEYYCYLITCIQMIFLGHFQCENPN